MSRIKRPTKGVLQARLPEYSTRSLAATITFDTLAYSKKLKAAGFTDEQAEVQAEALGELIEERLITKRDIGLSSGNNWPIFYASLCLQQQGPDCRQMECPWKSSYIQQQEELFLHSPLS